MMITGLFETLPLYFHCKKHIDVNEARQSAAEPPNLRAPVRDAGQGEQAGEAAQGGEIQTQFRV